jgi:CRP-like cAMP-binding protein
MSRIFYKETIKMFPILQNRANYFYSKYLPKITSRSFYQKEFLAKRMREEKQVYFIIQGVVANRTSMRFYHKGHMLNSLSIYSKQPSQYSLIAFSPIVNTLLFERDDFINILNEFEDLKNDIREMQEKETRINSDRKYLVENLKNSRYKQRLKTISNDITAEITMKNQGTEAIKIKDKYLSKLNYDITSKPRKTVKFGDKIDNKIENELSEGLDMIKQNSIHAGNASTHHFQEKERRIQRRKSVRNSNLKQFKLSVIQNQIRFSELNIVSKEETLKLADQAALEIQKGVSLDKSEVKSMFELDLINNLTKSYANKGIYTNERIMKLQKLRNIQLNLLPVFLKSIEILKSQFVRMSHIRSKYKEQELPLYTECLFVHGMQGCRHYMKILQTLQTLIMKNNSFILVLLQNSEAQNDIRNQVESQMQSITNLLSFEQHQKLTQACMINNLVLNNKSR